MSCLETASSGKTSWAGLQWWTQMVSLDHFYSFRWLLFFMIVAITFIHCSISSKSIALVGLLPYSILVRIFKCVRDSFSAVSEMAPYS